MVNWFTADPRFGHNNVIEFCDSPSRSTAHMEQVLVDNPLASAGAEDDLWILGDVVVGPRAESLNWLDSMFGFLPAPCVSVVVRRSTFPLFYMWAG
ncbi:MAG: hypothetical protein KKC72_14750 [Alphaproteobacteria bacterium]|nr:hypothetical protein [Alphaproteobacteria bacterium]